MGIDGFGMFVALVNLAAAAIAIGGYAESFPIGIAVVNLGVFFIIIASLDK